MNSEKFTDEFNRKFDDELKNDVIEMHKKGISGNEIAKTLRQSPGQILDIIWSYHETRI